MGIEVNGKNPNIQQLSGNQKDESVKKGNNPFAVNVDFNFDLKGIKEKIEKDPDSAKVEVNNLMNYMEKHESNYEVKQDASSGSLALNPNYKLKFDEAKKWLTDHPEARDLVNSSEVFGKSVETYKKDIKVEQGFPNSKVNEPDTDEWKAHQEEMEKRKAEFMEEHPEYAKESKIRDSWGPQSSGIPNYDYNTVREGDREYDAYMKEFEAQYEKEHPEYAKQKQAYEEVKEETKQKDEERRRKAIQEGPMMYT